MAVVISNSLTTLRQRFERQQRNAKQRGIRWELSFSEWLTIWGDNIDKRGRGRDQLCMARKGDIGPYAIGNVQIITNAENIREQQHTDDRKRKVSEGSKTLWRDETHRRRMSRSTSERNIKRWNDYDYRKQMSEAFSESAKRRWADPEKRAAVVAAQNSAKRDPERRAENSSRTKAKWADPGFRAKVIAAQQAARERRRSSTCQS
jgi:hypothetical protein